MTRFVAITILLLALALQAGASVKVAVRPESVVVPARAVALKDIASIQGSGAGQAGAIVVATAPMPGESRSVDLKYIKLRMTAAGMSADGLTGPAKATLIGKCRKWTATELGDTAKEFLLAQLPKDDRTYEVSVDRGPRELTIGTDDSAEIKPRLLNNSARLGSNTVALDVVAGDRTVASATATLKVTAVADVLVTTAPVRQGEAITGQNTTLVRREIKNGLETPLTQPEGVQLEARRSLPQGKVLSGSDVCTPAVIRKGDSVTVLVKCGRVKLAATGEAQQDGRLGETISVKTSVSTTTVRGRITEPGVIEISR